MANMKDIAARAGVSLGTVSHVLNGSAKVREPLRQRVLDAVAACGYQPSQLARGLRRVQTNMVGMVIPDITNPFFPAVVRGAEDLCFAHGYRLVLCNTDNDPAKEQAHLAALRSYLPAGLILIPSNSADLSAQVESYRAANTAVVCLDRKLEGFDADTVTVANEEGSSLATEHLIEMGHTRLALIGGPLQLTSARQRRRGFERAVAKAKLPVPAEWMQETDFDQAGGREKALLLLRMEPRPTAIVAGNDLIALGALRAVHEMGLRCPEDVSIIGFDNLDIAELTNPPLSSVYQPGYQIGSTAMHLLLQRIKGEAGAPQHLVLSTELRIRGSAAAPHPVEVMRKAARA